ncbi:very short patch repair endonuclease [Bosea sp. 124]|uniref:very short patch repair endonuclease n=1 Tax=Bosea sp. 124 TaxID=2135642 RepID=UPI000D3732A8|nr:very short patch repair endonuclease [Bosea sp. 124]PTM40610.1 T/G mismatch-specific endonuclease [Bosea sp. 124]
MADTVSPEVRSRMMSGIRGRDTKPEMILRKGLHAAGFRFRLHDRALPGRPDMVFPRRRAVLFAHGCFWHGHDCHLFRWPASRDEFWRTKIRRNQEVDERATEHLGAAGWRHGVVWECALKGRTRLPLADVIEACASWLRSDVPTLEIRGLA